MRRSKFKKGDRVRFTYAGPNFNRVGTVEHVRRDELLIVHFDDAPENAILVVRPYEIVSDTGRLNPSGSGEPIMKMRPRMPVPTWSPLRSGKQRGVRYAVWLDPHPRVPTRRYLSVVWVPEIDAEGNRSERAEPVRSNATLEAAMSHVDQITSWVWRDEQKWVKRGHPSAIAENPLSSGVVVAVAAVGGLAAAIYYFTRPAKPATSARGLYGAPGAAELGTIGAPVWDGALGTWCYRDPNGALVCFEPVPKPKHLGV